MIYSNAKLRDAKYDRTAHGLPSLSKVECARLSKVCNDEFKTLPEDVQLDYIDEAREKKRQPVDSTGAECKYNSNHRLLLKGSVTSADPKIMCIYYLFVLLF
jgi:hypothetical protein